MGACCSRSRQESLLHPDDNTQRIIIPQGLINPTSLNVIEIPSRLSETPVLYARRQYCCAQTTAGIQKLTVDRSRIRPPIEPTYIPPLRSQSYPALNYYTPPPLQQQGMNTYETTANSLSGTTMTMTTRVLENADLVEKEQTERAILEQDLDQFQQARRQLLQHTNELASRSYLDNEN